MANAATMASAAPAAAPAAAATVRGAAAGNIGFRGAGMLLIKGETQLLQDLKQQRQVLPGQPEGIFVGLLCFAWLLLLLLLLLLSLLYSRQLRIQAPT
jgi:Na+/phosphate symporter